MNRLTDLFDTLPQLARGPGGAAAVIHGGAVVESRCWGYADMERRIPFTRHTVAPLCSITKQFLCATLLTRIDDFTQLDPIVADWLPNLRGPRPTVRQMCHMQSGLPDYWAQTVLSGAMPDGEFRPHQARELIRLTERTRFAPGSGYSYANANFRILGNALEDVTGHPLGALMATDVFDPADMATATFAPETACHPGEAIGYECTPETGFVRANNRIHWFGDAGICGSLEDMIAWEVFIQKTRTQTDSLYTRLSAPQTFSDGTPASYGFGLMHQTRGGRHYTAHGGGLPGWSLHRLYCPEADLSVVVILNHRAVSARTLVLTLFDRALGWEEPNPPLLADPTWIGSFYDAASGLLLDITTTPSGHPQVRFEAAPEPLQQVDGNQAVSENMALTRKGDQITMALPRDNFSGHFTRVFPPTEADIEGRYFCPELRATFTCSATGNSFYGAFDGLLGAGPIHAMSPVGQDIWRLHCTRAMDAAAPGDWAIRFERDPQGKITGMEMGCWLARNMRFDRLD